MAIQFPLHRAISLCKLSLRHQLNCFLICAKSFVAQYLPKIQSKQRLQRFGFTLALKQSQITKFQTLAALKVKPQYNTAMNVDARVGMDATDMLGLGSFMLGGATGDNLTGGIKSDLLVGNAGNDTLNGGDGDDVILGGGNGKTIKSHYITSNKLPCKPISIGVAGLLLFNLNIQKTAANDATYNNTNERKVA